jgi:two-component system, sensor histidine kinase and response regulator
MCEETLRLLVVDDEPGMRMGVTRALRNFKVQVPEVEGTFAFDVGQAEDGEGAIGKINDSAPDILLLDHKLPGISGLELLEKVDVRKTGMLVIMITAYASIEAAVTATRRGAYDFLAKPFTPDELKAAVRKAAGRVMLSRQARRLAEEKKRVRFEFIRVLGHELKAPLNAVEGYLQLLEDESLGPLDEGYKQPVKRSIIRLEHMRKLIVDLLDMTRIESGEKQRELVGVDVLAVARESIETMLPSAEERGISITLDAPEPVRMHADAGELQIVFNNLISNAVKYNRDGGRVEVGVRREEDEVAISVSDTGIGMTPDEVKKLFGEFVRIRNKKTRNILGSGLGLSILQKITELYQGSAHVDSVPDEGSTFTIRLKADGPANERPDGKAES